MEDDDIRKLELIIYLIVVVALLAAFFNLPWAITNFIIQWLISAFIGSFLSLLAGSLVEAFTGDFLKKIAIQISIRGFKVSITAFAIATFIVKVALFGF